MRPEVGTCSPGGIEVAGSNPLMVKVVGGTASIGGGIDIIVTIGTLGWGSTLMVEGAISGGGPWW